MKKKNQKIHRVFFDPIYRSRIINLFGIDGKKDFRIAQDIAWSNRWEYE